MSGRVTDAGAGATADEATLKRLNLEHLAAYMAGDAAWFDRHLAADFVRHGSDGSVASRSEFLRQVAAGPDVTEYRLYKVRVRLDGDTAAIAGTGSFISPDGTTGIIRYVDRYRCDASEWKVSSAEVERIVNPKPKP